MIELPELYKERIFSYADVGFEQTIIINLTKGKVVSDKKGNSQQNIKFLGFVVTASISKYTYLDEKCWIIFPKITFQTMLFNYCKTRNELDKLLQRDMDLQISFVKKNKKKYVVKSIKTINEVDEARYNDII